ncbi:MAG: HAD-IA family hydrolase [Alphaproteobacteria bacterium]|nr:HAD-IA family hydrolase [Alphaproteobacteria bacterium]
MTDVPEKPDDLWLVFDLGGVLFDFHGIAGLAAITGRAEDDIHGALRHSPACRLYETGAATGEEFAALLAGELDLDMAPAELLGRWEGWLGGAKPGARALLADAGARYHTACLSNTSAVHWKGLTGTHGVDRLFRRTFASHLIGYWKPDPRIFAHVAGALGPAVARIVYFDDNQHIVDGARAVGWDAHLAKGPADVRGALARLGLAV